MRGAGLHTIQVLIIENEAIVLFKRDNASHLRITTRIQKMTNGNPCCLQIKLTLASDSPVVNHNYQEGHLSSLIITAHYLVAVHNAPKSELLLEVVYEQAWIKSEHQLRIIK